MIAELVLPRVFISLARAIEPFWQVSCHALSTGGDRYSEVTECISATSLARQKWPPVRVARGRRDVWPQTGTIGSEADGAESRLRAR